MGEVGQTHSSCTLATRFRATRSPARSEGEKSGTARDRLGNRRHLRARAREYILDLYKL